MSSGTISSHICTAADHEHAIGSAAPALARWPALTLRTFASPLERRVQDSLDLLHTQHDHALVPGAAILAVRITVGDDDAVLQLVNEDAVRVRFVELVPQRPEEILVAVGKVGPDTLVPRSVARHRAPSLRQTLELLHQRL